jgi:hypothetical protein
MWTRAIIVAALSIFVFRLGANADSTATLEVNKIAKCQRKIAQAGAQFAQRVIRSTLKCTNEVAECQVQCDFGVFGPSCDNSPPPCCDSDDPSSNQAFGACMDHANTICSVEDEKMVLYEDQKQNAISAACIPLTPDELCGANGEGLNFALLNAGCEALDPNYQCSLTGLINCVGGPLEHQIADQISALLDPRAPDAIAALNLQSKFPDLPVTSKVKGQVAAGKVDIWSINAQAGDDVIVRVQTRDDNGNQTSNLHPGLTLLGADQHSTVADTTVRSAPCGVPNVCNSSCPAFKRSIPFSGTSYIAVRGLNDAPCTGGKYRLVVVSPHGATPVLVADDVDPTP